MSKPVILDAWGRPIERGALSQEIAPPRVGSARNPTAGYPADGLTPVRLAAILRYADMGEPRQFLELAEAIEERDPHYRSVISTRRQSVAQLDITVDAASDDPDDVMRAEMVRDWLKRDELAGEIFNILDCLSKGYSGTEVVYETSEGQYVPRLIHRDPRSFRFDRNDLETPMLISDTGQPEPLLPGKFIWATIKTKSGLAVRSGLARVAAWGWMFKAYTQRDWAIFTQTYGQPIRVGRFGSGASDEDKATLFKAVSDIAGDCAAIIPESMNLEFVESKNVGAAHQLYKERCDWIDQQISKAVLGQTSTTDAVVGGLGSGKEHREVQKDIETADARALAAILNRDLIRVWMQLEFGPLARYPRLRIGRTEREDLKVLSEAVGSMIDRGLEVEQSEIRDRFGLSEPAAGAKLMRPSGAAAPGADPLPGNSKFKRVSGEFKRVDAVPDMVAAQQSQGPLVAKIQGSDPGAVLTDRLEVEAAPAMDAIIGQIEAMLQAAGSFEEFRAMLLEGFPAINGAGLAVALAEGMQVAGLGGRVAAIEGSE